MLCVSIEIFSHASAKKKTKRLKGFRFCTVIGSFKLHYGREGFNDLSGKGAGCLIRFG